LVALQHQLALAVGLWIVAAAAMSRVTGRVTDWFDMTDELRYERLAISIAKTGSPLPRIHETAVRDLDQLYPLLIAPFFRHGDVAADLHQAHLAGAWLMTSACIPAFLLARRVSGRSWVGWLVAVSSLAIPWMIYSSFLLTETVAYPVFLWTMLALQRTVAAPSARADLVAVVALMVAFFARTEFVAFVVVLPLAVLAAELTAAEGPLPGRAKTAARRSVRAHPILLAVYGALIAIVAVYTALGGHVLGLSAYGQTVPTSLFPPGLAQLSAGYVAQLAFGLGLLPFIVGTGWLFANAGSQTASRETQAFAFVSAATFCLLVLEVSKYSLGWDGVIYERFLFYFAPIILLALVCALLDERWPRWSLLVPLGVVCAGFAFSAQREYTWRGGRVNTDTPISILYHPLVETGGSKAAMEAMLVIAAVALTAVMLLLGRVAKSRRTAVVVIMLAVGLLASETGYTYVRLFRTTSNSERPLTTPVPSTLAWVDKLVGAQANVTVIPSHVSTDYFVNLKYWRDIEFWNKSVDRNVEYPDTGPYDYTGVWFPKQRLTFDPRTGAASDSPSRYAVQSITDTRLGLDGTVVGQDPNNANLIDVHQPWRASFLTFGTYDDGWLEPGKPAVIRVYSLPGQRQARQRILSLQIWAPSGVDARPFVVRSNQATIRRVADVDAGTTFLNDIPVCVPPHGYADVTVSARGSSVIPGDQSSYAGSLGQRVGSIYLADASASNYLADKCHP
jgi:hypothetical protein